jgi:hypothetical protein
VVLVGVQLSEPGLYLPPVLRKQSRLHPVPPHTIISLPVQTAVWPARPAGALVVDVAIQLSVSGLYLAPVVNGGRGVGVGVGVGGEAGLALSLPRVSSWTLPSTPPQTIIPLPVQTAVEEYRASGAFVVLVDVQLSKPGLYLPPVFNPPPQIIISLPVQTAV